MLSLTVLYYYYCVILSMGLCDPVTAAVSDQPRVFSRRHGGCATPSTPPLRADPAVRVVDCRTD